MIERLAIKNFDASNIIEEIIENYLDIYSDEVPKEEFL